MKPAFFFMMVLAILVVLLAGCTSQQPVPATPMTTSPSTAVPTVTLPVVPENLAGNWQLTTMGIQDGTAVTHPTTAITLYVGSDGTLSGYGGCNNYNGPYSLTGATTDKGTSITIGPLTSTKMYCQTTSSQESSYLEILGKTIAYNVDTTQLTLTASDQNVLIYQRPSTIPVVTEGMLPA